MSQLVTEHGQKIEKVLVAVPCGDMVSAGFAQDLANLVGWTTFARPDTQVSLYFLRGTYLPRARAGLVVKALELACSHILWLDADMRFPKDTLVRLLMADKPIVAANYATRTAPIIPTAVDAERMELFAQSEEYQDVRYAGMGVMLTTAQVFLDIGKPWFAVGYSPASDDYAGEDVFFCEKARKHGYQILVDSALSDHVRHVGSFEYTMDHARMTLAAAVKQEAGETHGADDVD